MGLEPTPRGPRPRVLPLTPRPPETSHQPHRALWPTCFRLEAAPASAPSGANHSIAGAGVEPAAPGHGPGEVPFLHPASSRNPRCRRSRALSCAPRRGVPATSGRLCGAQPLPTRRFGDRRRTVPEGSRVSLGPVRRRRRGVAGAQHRCQTARRALKRRTPHLPGAGGAFGKIPWGSALSARFPPILRPYVVSARNRDLGRSCDRCDTASWRPGARSAPTRGIEGPPAATSPLPGAGRARRPPGRRVAAPCPRVFEFDRSSSRASRSSVRASRPRAKKIAPPMPRRTGFRRIDRIGTRLPERRI